MISTFAMIRRAEPKVRQPEDFPKGNPKASLGAGSSPSGTRPRTGSGRAGCGRPAVSGICLMFLVGLRPESRSAAPRRFSCDDRSLRLIASRNRTFRLVSRNFARFSKIASAQLSFAHERVRSAENQGRCGFCADTPLILRGSVGNSAAPRERETLAHVGPRSRRFWIFVWPQSRVGDVSWQRWIICDFHPILWKTDLRGCRLAV